jgi:pimeloyl-ACP methyl ester carboxylesterase
MSVSLIYAVHGFLGQSTDWSKVKNNTYESAQWKAVDLFKPGAFDVMDLQFVRNFEGKKIFVGYSLGGRMGLSLLSEQSNLFDHFIFVSVHPGFKDEELQIRSQRFVQDQKWADKISTSNWNNFLSEWNVNCKF